MFKQARFILSSIFFLLFAHHANAQDNALGSAKHAVGFTGGGAVGSGISYRMYRERSFYQASFFIRANRREDLNNFVVGGSYGHILSEISIVKALPPTALVFVAGVQGLYSKAYPENDVSNQTLEVNKSFQTGAGIALEIGNTFSPGLLFTLGTTYVLSLENNDGESEWNLGPQLNIGMLYNW